MQQLDFFSASACERTHGNPHVSPAPAHDHGSLVDLLDIVVNKRLKKTWRVKVNIWTGERVLSVPPILAAPPEHIRDCLVRWALLPMGRRARRKPGYVKNKRELENAIRAYMNSCAPSKRKTRIDPKIFEHQTKGFVFDLRVIFDVLNRAYFEDKIESYIRWGHAASRTSYQDSRIDKNGNEFNLITVSGVYDSPKVPEYAIYGLIYHEMLHIAIPPKTVNGRRIIHGREFKAAMKKYPFEAEWNEWEKTHMGKLIQNARRRVKRKGKGAAQQRPR